MAPPKDIARSYPKRGLTADVGFRSEPKFCGDGSAYFDNDNATATLSTTPGSSFSYGLWMNVSDFVPSSNAVLIEIGAAGSAGSQVTITLTSTGQVQIFNGSSFIGATAANTVSLNTWHFIAVAVDGSSGGLKIYVDGVDVTGSHTATFNVTDKGMTVGAYASGSTFYTEGNLANVFYCTEILTQDQVRQIMRFSSSAQFATITGMESFYPLSADFNDAIGSANLTNNGATLQVKKPQLPRGLDLARGASMAQVYSGRAVEFDGSADYLQTTLDSALGETFTVSAWVYRTSPVSGFDVIWETGTFGSNASLRPAIKNTTEGLIDLNDNAGVAVSTKGVGLDRWAHVVICAIAGAGNSKIYVDGVDATPASHSVFVNATNALFEIGRYIGGAHYFKGYISDVRVFNSTLTADQVKELFHYPEQVLPTGVGASNLIHRWALSDYNDTGGTGGRYFQDSAGNNAMEDKSSAGMEFAQPVPCPQLGLQQSATRLYFPANTANYADFTLGSALGSSFTYATWVQPVNNNSQGLYCLFTSGASDQFSAYMLSAGTIQAGNTSNVTTTETVTLGDWTHIVITGDSSSPHAKIYINGSAATLSGTIDSAGMTQTGIRLGMRGASSTANRQAHCIFAESAFWDVNLSPSEVSTLYNSGVMGFDTSSVQSSQLKAWHKYDDLTTLKDYSGEGRNATVSGTFNAASFPENASGSTIVGDFTLKRRGVSVLNKTEDDNDVIAIIPANADVFPTSQGFTLSVWLRGGQEASRNAYIVATTNRTAAQRFGIYTQSGASYWGLEMPVSSSPTTADAAITYDPNEWACLSFTLDFGTNTVKMYTNGALQTTVTRSLTVPTTFSDINVGGSGAAHPTITGTTPIALFKTAQRTWSDDEVKRNYYSDLRLIKGLDNE